MDGTRLTFGDREKETRGKPAMGTAYSITNSGSKTIFQCDSGAPTPLPAAIRRFDEFQQALLKNYAEYARAASAAAADERAAHNRGVTMKE